jgi:hypothetical protein
MPGSCSLRSFCGSTGISLRPIAIAKVCFLFLLPTSFYGEVFFFLCYLLAFRITAVPEASLEALRVQVAALQGIVFAFPVNPLFPYPSTTALLTLFLPLCRRKRAAHPAAAGGP